MSDKSPPRKDPEVEGEGGEDGACTAEACMIIHGVQWGCVMDVWID